MVDIFTTEKKYNIIYADPPWTYGGGGRTIGRLELQNHIIV